MPKPSLSPTSPAIHVSLKAANRHRIAHGRRYRRVEWRCDVENLVAKKAGERMGFHQEGVLRKDRIWREVNRDTAVMSMTNSDWRDGTDEALAARLRRRVKGVEGAAHVARRLLQQLDEMEEDEARKKEQ
jgi:hypothetical protein